MRPGSYPSACPCRLSRVTGSPGNLPPLLGATMMLPPLNLFRKRRALLTAVLHSRDLLELDFLKGTKGREIEQQKSHGSRLSRLARALFKTHSCLQMVTKKECQPSLLGSSSPPPSHSAAAPSSPSPQGVSPPHLPVLYHLDHLWPLSCASFPLSPTSTI